MGTTYKRYSEIMERYYQTKYQYADNFLTYNHRIIRFSLILTIDKLTSRELYSYLILTRKIAPSPNTYFENLFVVNGKPSTSYHEKLHLTLTYSHFSIIF